MFFVVGVFADDVIASAEYKGRPPVIPCEDRVRLVAALKCVDGWLFSDRNNGAAANVRRMSSRESWGSHLNIEAVEYMIVNGRVVGFLYQRFPQRRSSQHHRATGKASTSCP